jgi:CheY-like chemotaxis protein
MAGQHHRHPNQSPQGGGISVMSHRLLVIDDAAVHRMILCRVAEKLGFEVTGASSFAEAEAQLRSGRFDGITLDLSLGDRAGVEILRLLSDLKSEAPIIVISGSESTILHESVRIGKSLGLDIKAPISKPVDLSVFRDELTKIGKQVDLRKLARVSS